MEFIKVRRGGGGSAFYEFYSQNSFFFYWWLSLLVILVLWITLNQTTLTAPLSHWLNLGKSTMIKNKATTTNACLSWHRLSSSSIRFAAIWLQLPPLVPAGWDAPAGILHLPAQLSRSLPSLSHPWSFPAGLGRPPTPAEPWSEQPLWIGGHFGTFKYHFTLLNSVPM